MNKESQEKREKMHKILDLVLDINEFEERQRRNTGDKPTVFMSFDGHTCCLRVNVYKEGWESFEDKGLEKYKKYLAEGTYAFDDSLESIITSLDNIKRRQRQKEFKQCAGM